MKIDEIGSWEAFMGVATHGNFSKAAHALRVPVAQVSKRIAKLENQLNVRLFQRTTRVVTLTDEGKSLLPKITSILQDLQEAESSFEENQELTGVVKLTCPPFVGHRLVLPLLHRFREKQPQIHLEIDVSEGFVNLIDRGFDMALRIETPSDSELVYRKLAPNVLVFSASPEYLKKNPAPKTPKDLAKHDLLMLSTHRRVKWKNEESRLGDFARQKKITCENGNFLTDLAVNGHGILVRSIWDVEGHIKEGRLVPILKNYPLENFGYLHAVVPSKRFLAPRVKAFWDFIVENLATNAEEDK